MDGIVLEMTDPAQLRPSPRVVDVALVEVLPSAAARLGVLYREIWAPIGVSGRTHWTDEQWADELSRPGVRAWVVQRSGADLGFAELGWSGRGDAAFVVVGVVPSAQGLGIGGDLVSRLTRSMWETPAADGTATRRVWLWTRPDEHPHAIPNYHARGFVVAEDG